jgi:hypothetical protein
VVSYHQINKISRDKMTAYLSSSYGTENRIVTEFNS